MKRAFVIAVLMLVPMAVNAATIHVPGDQPTIQAGIDAAVDGDTVIVAPGTYVENINFLGKAITLTSEQGPEATIIDGSSPPDPDFGCVVTFENDEGPDSVLDGFTLTNGTGNLFPGQGYNGGGVFTHYASPTITGNIITGNLLLYDFSHGGGIFASHASPTITGNTISGNRAAAGGGIDFQLNCFSIVADNSITENTSPYFGGGITVSYSCDPVIRNNIIDENVADEYGGGILVGINCSPTITGNSINLNSATISGGGIFLQDDCHPVITGNTINENWASTNSGGGIYLQDDCHPAITNNIITNNSALNWGGGLYCWGAAGVQAPSVTSNIFVGNSADEGGGAISCNEYDSMTISNNTITENSSITYGGAIECWQSSLVILNTICWNNTAPIGTEIWVGDAAQPSTLTVNFSDIGGGQASVYVETGSTLTWGGGMIEVDPQFIEPSVGNYHLCQDPCQPGVVNPCVDGGHPFSPMIAGTTRTDGIFDVGRVDMGYHYTLVDTVTADLSCVPDSGVLPFTPQFNVTLGNAVAFDRTVAGRIDLTTAGGETYQSWRAGFTNLGPSETFVTTWMQTLPALGSLVGTNVFELHTEDVTPPPYNQPPYPPSGDIDTCTVTVVASVP